VEIFFNKKYRPTLPFLKNPKRHPLYTIKDILNFLSNYKLVLILLKHSLYKQQIQEL